jgi:lysophospholipase L1-like esterase
VKSLSFIVAVLLLSSPARAAEPFKLADGDRVAFLGNTVIEREQRYGYWELALTARHPQHKVLFRNLGWSGDTVFGHARAGFGDTAHGFNQLKKEVAAVKPTVLIVGYGSNEAFDGPTALPAFVKGLNTLLDALAPTKARIVLLSPLRQEDLGPPLPDPTAQNKNLRLYANAIRDVAKKRKHLFIDLYDLLRDGAKAKPAVPLTDNGIHPTAWGYWRSAFALERGLGWKEPRWRVEIDAGTRKRKALGARVVKLLGGPLRFQVTDTVLPVARPPKAGAPKKALPLGERTLVVKGLAAGDYTLTVDGKEVVKASAADWAKGVRLERGPEFDQAEKLRQAIRNKNVLFFHRWRPQNETYLFGFRKHEQGKNAREIPQFDPLVATKEKEIARLRVPVAHRYELKPSSKR